MILKITGAYIAVPAKSEIEVQKKDIFIVDGIVQFTPPMEFPDRIIDASGNVILPGLVNAHNHIYSVLSKGLPVDTPLGDFLGNLKNLWWILDRALSKEDMVLSTVIALRESIKNGVTTIFDHHICSYADNALSDMAEVFDSYGISGTLAFETSDRNGGDFFEKSLYENVRFTESRKGKSVQGMIGLHASFTLSDTSMKAIAYTSDNYPIHVHIAEGKIDAEDCMKKYGIGLMERFREFNLIRDNSLFVHCSNCTADDLKILSEKNVSIAQAVESNMNNGLHIGNASDFIGRGIRTTSGTDGMHSNVLKAMKNSMLTAKCLNRNCDIGFSEMKSLFLSSFELKKAFGFPVGVIEGEPADLAVFDYMPMNPLDNDNFLSHFIYGITESRCRYVLKQGKLLLDDYQISENPLDGILDDAEKISAELFRKFEKNKGKFS